MTFLRQIQNLLERTYTPTGVNMEECLITTQRCVELSSLAGPMAHDLSMEGRTFLRVVGGNLHLAIYYHPSVIAALEAHHPFNELNDSNIRPLITFLEELNHAVHAALLFHENRLQIESEDSLSNLELQGKIDTYLALKLIVTILRNRKHVLVKQERWLQTCLFRQETFNYQDSMIETRYREANRLGLRLVKHLDRMNAGSRIELIRDLRPKSFMEKKDFILSI